MGKKKPNVESDCICSKCRKRFDYADAVVKKRKLFNTEIEEKTCPFCGSKAFTKMKDMYYLGQMGGYHKASGKV